MHNHQHMHFLFFRSKIWRFPVFWISRFQPANGNVTSQRRAWYKYSNMVKLAQNRLFSVPSRRHLKPPVLLLNQPIRFNKLPKAQISRIHLFSYTWEFNCRLPHSASELSGFTCTSSLTMNEKFQYRTRPPRAILKNFEFNVSERVQVNPDNSRAMSALTFLLFKLNTLQAKIVKFWVSQSHGVMTVVYRIYTTAISPR